MTAADAQTLPALSMADLPSSIGAAKALLCLSGYAGIRCWHPKLVVASGCLWGAGSWSTRCTAERHAQLNK